MEKTTYIIGAGASYELQLPTGEELKSIISKLLDIKFDFRKQISGDHQIVTALRTYCQEKEEDLESYRQECQHISKNMPLSISIDNFIDTQRGNDKLELCGKLAIVQSIVKAEKKSLLYPKNSKGINFMILANTWYLPFFKTLTENCTVEELTERFKSITLIIFNYDRCLEHFMVNALQQYYRISNKKAIELISYIKILHPYGTIGCLPWQNKNSEITVGFGENINTRELIDCAQNIKTFTEGMESNELNRLHLIMSKCDRLIFLGFAFHKLNMKLLGKGGFMNSYNYEGVNCFGTTFGMSESDKSAVETLINALYDDKVKSNLENLTCSKFFEEYSRSLGY